MADVNFYHLTAHRVERALPSLLKRILKAGQRAVVRVGSEDRMKRLNKVLWTYDPASFLPHGMRREGFAERQPIYITVGNENPNGAEILVLLEGVMPMSLGDYKRCLYMFEADNTPAIITARKHWQQLIDAGHDVTYWRQGDSGKWIEGEPEPPAK